MYFDGTVEYFFKNYTYQFDKSNFDLSRFPFDSHNIRTVIKLNMDDSAKISPSSYFIKKFKLEVAFNPKNYLVSILNTVSKEKMFNEKYPYKSSESITMEEEPLTEKENY